MADSLEYLALNVSDIDSAVAWYTSSFDCTVASKSADRALLQFANVKLQLVLPSSERPHAAFIKADAASFGELRSRGDEQPSTYVSDPAGNIIKLLAP